MPARPGTCLTPDVSADLSCAPVRSRLSDLKSPATPETRGAAADVPLTKSYPPPAFVESMRTPGAAIVARSAPQFEKGASASDSSVAATETRFGRSKEAG